MRLNLLGQDLEPDDVAPCYFLHGEETFLAREFLDQLCRLLVPPEVEDFRLERFFRDETGWAEVLDAARTAPFLFAPWRVIAFELGSSDRSEREEGEGGGASKFSDADEALLKAYLESPAGRTVLVVVLPGQANPSRRIVKFFGSFPEAKVVVRELKPLKGPGLQSWIDRRLAASGKAMTAEAKTRLAALVGHDLQRLDTELEKLAAYVGEKKAIDADDVDAASGQTKELEGWELTAALEARDARRALTALANFYTEGKAPELILGILSREFRDFLFAQEGLREGEDPREVFKRVRPQIRESYGGWFTTQMNAFLGCVRGLSPEDLQQDLEGLGRIDYRMKNTDANTRTDIEAFVVEFCRTRRPEGVSSKPARRWPGRPGG